MKTLLSLILASFLSLNSANQKDGKGETGHLPEEAGTASDAKEGKNSLSRILKDKSHSKGDRKRNCEEEQNRETEREEGKRSQTERK